MILTKSRPISSWNQQKLDLGGCVLYVLLWRPDMVARGGSIKNGTGILNVSSQNLAVGVNTLTATGAGTFLISVPYNATCASGTATITGSPVTLNPGLNSVTTGVTTGTFTVTTSNIIRSKDSISHQMTVTGATWGIQGRTFDGLDDKITFGLTTQTGINGKNTATLEAWVKTPTMAAVTQYSIITHRKNDPVSVDNWQLVIYDKKVLCSFWISTVEKMVQGATTLAENTWYHITGIYDGSTVSIFVNAVLDQTPAAATGNIDSGSASWDIGCVFGNFTPAGVYKNIIGEIRMYNRPLTSAEIQLNYLSTRWRYS